MHSAEDRANGGALDEVVHAIAGRKVLLGVRAAVEAVRTEECGTLNDGGRVQELLILQKHMWKLTNPHPVGINARRDSSSTPPDLPTPGRIKRVEAEPPRPHSAPGLG